MTIHRIQNATLDILSQHLHPGDKVALLDFPNHGNSGDSLIYLGELAYLKRLGVHVDYVADATRYSVRELRRRVPVGPILIHGGGNFGDRWTVMQEMRETIVSDFPERRIIQLPQGIEFSPGLALEKAQRVLGRHTQLTLLIRDSAGVRRAKELFPASTVEFCPDMAFGFGAIEEQGDPSYEVVVLKRQDSESVEESIVIEAVAKEEDWGLKGWRRILSNALRGPGAAIKRLPALSIFLYPVQRHCYDSLASLHVNNAIRILSQGKVVVTDRLHATVIAGLMGKPVVGLNNANGKIKAIYSDYLSGLPGVHFVDNVDEANEMVSGLLRRHS